MELTKVIAENITRLLEENNLTQGELSNYLDISRQTLSNYLRGTSTIDTVRLVKTAEFLGVAPSVLLENSSSTTPPGVQYCLDQLFAHMIQSAVLSQPSSIIWRDMSISRKPLA